MTRHYFIMWTLLWTFELVADLIRANNADYEYNYHITSREEHDEPTYTSDTIQNTFERPKKEQSNWRFRKNEIQDGGRFTDKVADKFNEAPFGQLGVWRGIFRNSFYPENENNINNGKFNRMLDDGKTIMNFEMHRDKKREPHGGRWVEKNHDTHNKVRKDLFLVKSSPWVIESHQNFDTDHGFMHHPKDVRGRMNDYQNKRRNDKKLLHSGRGLLDSLLGGVTRVVKDVANEVIRTTNNAVDAVLRSVKYSARIVLDGLKKVGITGIVVGAKIIRPPLLGAENLVQSVSFVKSLGKDVLLQLTNDVRSGLQHGWESVTSLQLPGWDVIMFFPNGLICIVNSASNALWYLKSTTLTTIRAEKAWSIYVALDLISSTLGPAMTAVGMSCVTLKAMKMNVGKTVVDKIKTSSGEVCGISFIEAVNNVTITRDDKYFLIINVPFAINKLTVSFKNVTVSGLLGDLIEEAAMDVSIKRVSVNGKVLFQGGTLIKFMNIKLRVVKLADFKIKFIGSEDDQTNMMDLVENISDIIGPIVKETVNKHFAMLEQRISDFIVEG